MLNAIKKKKQQKICFAGKIFIFNKYTVFIVHFTLYPNLKYIIS